jgi:hypothetical protein
MEKVGFGGLLRKGQNQRFMAVGIIRARNISASTVGSTEAHNDRKYGEGQFPENINENGFHESQYPEGIDNLEDAIYNRIEQEEVTGIKKNTNVAIEYMTTINDPKVWDRYSPHGFFANTKQWLERHHGKGSVVATFEHLDESNPHAHFIVVPIKEKEIRWKNNKGEGKRIEKRLNTRDFTGGRDKLRNLQNEYHKYLKNEYENKMGVTFYRGTLVEHQKKEYIRKTDHKIGEMRAKLSDLTNERDKAVQEAKILIKEAKKASKELELAEIKDKKKLQKGVWKKKGVKHNPEIFHGEEKEQKKESTKGMKKPPQDKGFSM